MIRVVEVGVLIYVTCFGVTLGGFAMYDDEDDTDTEQLILWSIFWPVVWGLLLIVMPFKLSGLMVKRLKSLKALHIVINIEAPFIK